MGQIEDLRFLVKREGENGKIGPIKDVVRLNVADRRITKLLRDNYYIGALEEYEEFTGKPAGDVNDDGVVDQKDKSQTRRRKATLKAQK